MGTGLIPIDGGHRRRQSWSMTTKTAEIGSATRTDQPGTRQLRRSSQEKMLAGVASGIARYLDVDRTLVRVVIVALVLVTAAGAGVPLYIAAWLLIPADGEDQSIAAAWLQAHRHQCAEF